MNYKKMIIMALLMAVLLVSFGISDSEATAIDYQPCGMGDCEFAISTSFALCSFGTTTGTGDTFNYPYGLIGFTVASNSSLCPSRASISSVNTKGIAGISTRGTVTLIFRKSDHTTPLDLTGFVYRKYGHTSDNNTPHWYDFTYDATTDTGAVITGNQVVLHFVDSYRGDDDTAVNGVIVDPGGPGQPSTSVPTMTEWGMIVFMLLAGLGSVYYLRRQKRAEG